VLVTFLPTVVATETASLSINDNATGSPHTVPISASGYYGGSFSLNPAKLTFPPPTHGTSATSTIVFSNSGSTALAVSSFTITGANASDFTQTNTCGTSIVGGGNCTISVTFTPSTVGIESATLTIVDGGGYASPTTISLAGTGQ